MNKDAMLMQPESIDSVIIPQTREFFIYKNDLVPYRYKEIAMFTYGSRSHSLYFYPIRTKSSHQSGYYGSHHVAPIEDRQLEEVFPGHIVLSEVTGENQLIYIFMPGNVHHITWETYFDNDIDAGMPTDCISFYFRDHDFISNNIYFSSFEKREMRCWFPEKKKWEFMDRFRLQDALEDYGIDVRLYDFGCSDDEQLNPEEDAWVTSGDYVDILPYTDHGKNAR